MKLTDTVREDVHGCKSVQHWRHALYENSYKGVDLATLLGD